MSTDASLAKWSESVWIELAYVSLIVNKYLSLVFIYFY